MYNSPEDEVEQAMNELKRIMELRIRKNIMEECTTENIHLSKL